MKATKGFSVSDWCRNFEITFQGEQGGFDVCILAIFIKIDLTRKLYKNRYLVRQALIGVACDANGSN